MSAEEVNQEPVELSNEARLRVLADRLDCFTEYDLMVLTDTTPSTVEAWRKRGEGPAYVRAGNRYFYPRAKVVEWLHGRVRERGAAKDCL